MELSGHFHAPTALIKEKDPDTHWIEGWVAPGAGPGVVAETKTSLPYPCRKSNLCRPYYDWKFSMFYFTN
jgi:hypothetical protein